MRQSVFCFALHLAFAGPVFAQCSPVGGEFRVNTYTENQQYGPSVAGLSGGGFVVTWDSQDQDGSGFGVYGQVFDIPEIKAGLELSEFRVNTHTAGHQSESSVAALPGGGFVVTWQDGSNIKGQTFDSLGKKVGGEFRVNTYTKLGQHNPSVAALSGGGFVVIWEWTSKAPYLYSGMGQLFDGLGKKVGREFSVSKHRSYNYQFPKVAGLSGGGFVVTSQSQREYAGVFDVYGQVFDSAGRKMGDEFRVYPYPADIRGDPEVAGLSGGGFVVTWRQDAIGERGIYGQLFDRAGKKVGRGFKVSPSVQLGGKIVAGLPGGGFVVAWENEDIGERGIYGQLFDSKGTNLGSKFRVNSQTTEQQTYPTVAVLSDGGFVITWVRRNPDGREFDVYGQRFSCGSAVSAPRGLTVTP